MKIGLAAHLNLVCIAAAAVALTACGGGDSGWSGIPTTGGGTTTPTLTGAFYDVQGLRYVAGDKTGTTAGDGTFSYPKDASVKFSVGTLDLGSATPGERLTVAHLVGDVNGDVKKITNQKVTNLARFVLSLDDDANAENGVKINDATVAAVTKAAGNLNFDQTEAAFTADAAVVSLFGQLGRPLVSAPTARNYLRRTLLGIKKETNVAVPMRDGVKLLADVYRPIAAGKYPAIVTVGAYGKVFDQGCICNTDQYEAKAKEEDDYFEGKLTRSYEFQETINTVDWIPQGYVKVMVDDRGTCNSPGRFEQFSLQEARDYYDSVEWAGVADWSNGNVGMWGVSYWSMAAMNMAQLQPPHLKAMVPLFTDTNSYRDYMYNGGIWNVFNFLAGSSCTTPRDVVNFPMLARANPFDDQALYGPSGSLAISTDLSKITVPFYTAIPQEHPGIHIRGSSEAFIHAATPEANKRLAVIDGDIHGWMYTKEAVGEHLAFMDYWLKGKTDNGAMSGARVKMKVRTGDGNYQWQEENEWPIARTEYRKIHLDAQASSWAGDGKRADFKQLSAAEPSTDASISWSADVKTSFPANDIRSNAATCWQPGVSFVTEPLTADMTLAGYMKLSTWVSSSSSDMDMVVSVRVIDANNQEKRYAMYTGYGGVNYPVGHGWLKVSHRKTDPAKSNVYRPWHTHAQADYAPLGGASDVQPVEVEIWPSTALIKAGSRIRLDVQPVDQCAGPAPHLYDYSYKTGATNTLYTGPSHKSYLQIPVVPVR